MPEVYVIPETSQMILQLIVTLIMFLAVRYFLWGPVTKFIEAKKEISISEINEAKTKNLEADEYLESAKQEVKNAREKAAEIVNNSKLSANAVHDSILAETKKEVEYLKSNAKDAIETEKANFYDGLKNEVVDLTMEATSKILEREIDMKEHNDIIDSIIAGKIE